jgi:acyl carrier protein
MNELDPLEQKVIQLIAHKKRIEPERITLDSTFQELGIDSLDGMDLLFTFEESFQLSIPDDLARRMQSVREATEAIRAALAAAPPPPAH